MFVTCEVENQVFLKILKIMATFSAPTELDLAFIIDATGSMGMYIKSAQDVSIRLYEQQNSIKKTLFRICELLFKI